MSSKEELIRQLTELAKADPVGFELVKNLPEWQIVEKEVDKTLLIQRARVFSPDGFFAYYEGKYGFPPPKHIKRWIQMIFDGHERGLGFTLNGYRGCWKTVSISISFLEYFIGSFPWKTNLVIRASDTMADEITGKIVTTIKFLPWFASVFPNVIPDEEGRWSVNGYYVIDKSIERGEWTKLVSDNADPTLVGGGFTSQKINGKHPTGICLTDDIHGMNNSHSESERKTVVDFYVTELLNTFVHKEHKLETWPINIGVPWSTGGKDDTHQVLSKSGGFVHENFPVMVKANEGDEGATYIDGLNAETGATYDDIKGWWILDNPDKFGPDIIKQKRGADKFGFWQMMMMDVRSGTQGGLRYYSYPAGEIDVLWPVVGGCDPSFSFKERREYEVKSSFFSLAVVFKRPRGGAVLHSGVLDQCEPNVAAGYISAMKSRFMQYRDTFVEDNGIGRLFIETVRLINPSLNIICSDLYGMRLKGEKVGRAKDKTTRIRTELAPWLENATIFISDERSDYLDAVRDGLDNFYELDPHKPDKRWDALDAFYHAVKAMPDVLQQQAVKDELPSVFKQKSEHPLAGRLALRRSHR